MLGIGIAFTEISRTFLLLGATGVAAVLLALDASRGPTSSSGSKANYECLFPLATVRGPSLVFVIAFGALGGFPVYEIY